MSGNSFGSLYRLTSFGESHGKAIGGIIDGCPAGIELDLSAIQDDLDRRKPGQSSITTQRKEADELELLSGVFENKTLGTPIGFLIRNKEYKSGDYNHLKNVYRPSHADYTYDQKYGIRDHRGGGRSSARETIARVVAGSLAKQVLEQHKIRIRAYVKQIHDIMDNKAYTLEQLLAKKENSVKCPDQATADQMIDAIEKARNEGNSLGGIIHCMIEGLPAGIGEPVFDKFHARLGKAILSINAVKGVEFGMGFQSVIYKGSQLNDQFIVKDDEIRTSTNYSGGLQGGLTNGETVYFNVAFKPTASISSEQRTVTQSKEETSLHIKGRHDPCVLPRAVPIVEAMAAMVSLDFLLLQNAYKF